MKLVWDKTPTGENGRNSEGSFIRQPDGGILFAYSRYSSNAWDDGAHCDIAAIRSFDEGETWSEPEIIVRAEQYGVKNVMSVSAICQQDGTIGLYYIIKEAAGNNTIGRALSKDGYTFTVEHCTLQGPLSYYVFNNDRFIRLANGSIATAAAMHAYYGDGRIDAFGTSVGVLSNDDGKTFAVTPPRLTISRRSNDSRGMIEPGIIQHKDGTIRLWARTKEGWQYECYSRDNMQSFTAPTPSVFSAPDSPLEMLEHDGVIYAIYNPIPQYPTRICHSAGWGRTPLVIRRSTDDGKTWGQPTVIEGDEDRGYCYPAAFVTRDNAMLCAYCRGGAGEESVCLQRLGIMKIALDEIV